MEARIAALAKRYSAIEASIAELQRRATQHTPPSVTTAASASSSCGPARAQRQHVDPASLTALHPHEEDTAEVAAVRRWCLENGMHSAQFKWVPSNYYQENLQWRRDVLSAPSIQHLCKTIVLENTHCVNADCANRDNARFYMIVYQYVERFDSEMVMRTIKELNEGLGKKKFNFRLADPEKALELTGFTHGAVVPFATASPIPVILSANVARLSPPVFWVGGGHVDCKVRVDFEEFKAVMNPIIASITVPLTAEELNEIAD